MKISVLIAAYNAAATLEHALASVQNQTHRDWEIIVVEDGSNDGTEQLVHEAALSEMRSIRYERFETNRGVSSTRQRLLELATGDAVAFLDADDWWDPRHLELGGRKLAAGAGLVVMGVQTFDLQNGQILGTVVTPRTLETHPVETLFLESVIVTSSCVLLAKATVKATGKFDPAFTIGEDRDYWLRAALTGARFAVEPTLTCHYAKHAGSAMARSLKVADQAVRFFEKYFNLPAIPAGIRRRQLAHALLNAGRLSRKSDASASVQQLWRAWCLTPVNALIALQLAYSGTQLWRRQS